MVFDLTNQESFNSVRKEWMQTCRDSASPECMFFLVGNKIDLVQERQVHREEVEDYV
jgi:GTPase SAR1 family protein